MPDKCQNGNDCPMLPRISALERANEQHGKTHGEIYDRLRKVETENAVQVEQYNSILKELAVLTASHKELNAKLAAIEAKPGKRWDKMVETVLACIVTAVAAFLMGRIL